MLESEADYMRLLDQLSKVRWRGRIFFAQKIGKAQVNSGQWVFIFQNHNVKKLIILAVFPFSEEIT